MASFRDCIVSAQKQGVLGEDEADDLIRRYDEYREARRAAGDADVEGGAQTALAGELDALSARKKQLAALAEQKRDDIGDYLTTFRDLNGKKNVFEGAVNLIENFGGGAGTSSVKNRANAMIRLAHGELADMLSTFRRSRWTGQRFNKPQIDNVIREMKGEATGSPEAKAMADAVAHVNETLRGDFNKAGGDIGRLENYVPQDHDARAVLKAGFKDWRDYIVPKLDQEKMRDPLTGGALTPERLDATLKKSWEHITTAGWSDREPTAVPFGLGVLANQRGEHRFLHFKTADDWLAYNRDFGSGDPIKAIFQHIKGMSNDIAAMEILGPNPSATVNWLKQVIQSEVGKAIVGEPSLHSTSSPGKMLDQSKWLPYRLQSIYDNVRGREVVSNRWATGFANVSNLLTSAQLGGASILAAATDPFIDRSVRAFNGLPAAKALLGIAHAIRSSQSREQAVRSGLGLDDFMHILGDEARYAGTMSGSEWSRWLADRTVNLNGLEAITQARRHQFGLDFQAMAADHVATQFGELPPYFRRAMENYGLGTKDWDALRKTELHIPGEGSAGYLQPRDVSGRALGLRYLEMILGETERAVPTSTARSKSLVTGGRPRGDPFGEILGSALQYKSFALSFTTLQWQALKQELHEGPARGAAYAAALAIPLTLGGALSMQVKNIVNGKDLQDMDPSKGEGFKFWVQALQTGGGMGIIGDYLFSDQTRFGGGLIETLAGPTAGLISDAFKIAQSAWQKPGAGEKTHLGREIVRKASRYVPIVSTLPYTRAAYQRMFVDQLQYLADPDAHKFFREQQQRLRRETNQGYFWRPGETLPDRMPEMVQGKR